MGSWWRRKEQLCPGKGHGTHSIHHLQGCVGLAISTSPWWGLGFFFFFFLIIHFLKFYLFILGCAGCLWQLRLFSRCGERGATPCCGAQASLRWLLLLQSVGSGTSRLSGCSSQALEHRQSSCGAGSVDPWDLAGPEMELISPSLAGSLLLSHQGSPGLGFLAAILHKLWHQRQEKNR